MWYSAGVKVRVVLASDHAEGKGKQYEMLSGNLGRALGTADNRYKLCMMEYLRIGQYTFNPQLYIQVC